MKTTVLVLTGVSGSGKTTIGMLLAERLKWPYAEADAFHSAANVAKMAAGHPLTDDDRWPWLQAIAAWIDERIAGSENGVVTCSALKRKYRDILRRPETRFIYLHGTPELIAERIGARHGHYFKPGMLDSQFAALEEPSADEDVTAVDIAKTPSGIVDDILAAIRVDG
jgi:gluconokinase